jgi:hypothetical protein
VNTLNLTVNINQLISHNAGDSPTLKNANLLIKSSILRNKTLFASIFLQEPDQTLYKPALESLRTQIRSSTTSMTSVPKPLKFLRPHYETLKNVFEVIKDSETKVRSFIHSLFGGTIY